LGLPTLKSAKARGEEFAAQIAKLNPDVCAVVAWGALIPDSLLEVPKHGWVNLHFSLLPKWRGAAPVQHALLNGDTLTGVSTFQIVHDLDAGDIYRVREVEIDPDENAGQLLERLAVIGAEELVATFADIAAGAQPKPQPNEPITLAPKLSAEAGELGWEATATQIHNKVRGYSPNPGAWTLFRDQHFKILSTHIVEDFAGAPLLAGEIAATKKRVLVGTKDMPIELTKVQAFGKPAMNGADWARGANLNTGESFA
jgi:methionyl-tRNA formyltransferase